MDWSLLGFEGLWKVYNVHPAFVHFPVALLPSSFLLYLLGVLMRRRTLVTSGRSCLYLGFGGAAIAVLTGVLAEDTFPHGQQVHRMIETHEAIGWTVLSLSLLLTVWSFWRADGMPRHVWGFLGLLGVTSLLVLQNGDIGSRMVYLHGAAVKPAADSGSAQHGQSEGSGHRHHH
ncbi:MAG: hypothetical protein A2428_10100 [Bdellovibrionales bacterium RIFOXYC1_FULL_54_43]|nr:MAG: hypothetical protein A2428_10100 [Bdellovibrionales bacterium RIFOXYC1_FULL_54_43]